jgi:hypothetical protein
MFNTVDPEVVRRLRRDLNALHWELNQAQRKVRRMKLGIKVALFVLGVVVLVTLK